MNKRILLMLMAMIVAVTSWAQEASIGSVKYATFDEAWQAQKPNETIKLLKNVTVTKSYTVTGTRVIDLNAHLLTLPETAERQYLFIVRQNGVLKAAHGQLENFFHGTVTNQTDYSQNINSRKTGVVCALYGGMVELSDVWFKGGENQLYVGSLGTVKSHACRYDGVAENADYCIKVAKDGTFNSNYDMLWGKARQSNVMVEEGGNVTFYASDLFNNKPDGYSLSNHGTVSVFATKVTGGILFNGAAGDITIHNMKYADNNNTAYQKPIIDNYGNILIEDVETNTDIKHTSITSYSTTAAIRNNQSGILTIKGNRTLNLRPEIEQKGTGNALINYGIADIHDVIMQSSLSASTVVGMEGNINFYLDENSLVKNPNNSYCLETQGTGKITTWTDGCFYGRLKSDNNGLVLRRGYFNSYPSAFKYQYSQLLNLTSLYKGIYPYQLTLVSDNCEAAIGDSPYMTLEEALADAWPGCTVKLLRNIDLTKALDINQPRMTLDMNNCSLYGKTSVREKGVLQINAKGVRITNGLFNSINYESSIYVAPQASVSLHKLLLGADATGLYCEGEAELDSVQFDGQRNTNYWIKAVGNAVVTYNYQRTGPYRANYRITNVTGLAACVYVADNAQFTTSHIQYDYPMRTITFEAHGNARIYADHVSVNTSGTVLYMTDNAEVSINWSTLKGEALSGKGVMVCDKNGTGGNPTLEIYNTTIYDSSTSGAAVCLNGGQTVIGGRSTEITSKYNAVYASGSAQLDIRDGSYGGANYAVLSSGYTEIQDGIFEGKLRGNGLVIYGGTYTNDPTTFLAANRDKLYEDGIYKVYSTEGYKDYYLTLGGKDIKSHNCNDIFGDGTARFNPDTKTLTLENAHIPAALDGSEALLTGSYGYQIKVELIGYNVIDGPIVSNDIRFIGNGMLTINGAVLNHNDMYVSGPQVVFFGGVTFWHENTSRLYVSGTGRFISRNSNGEAVSGLSSFVPGDHIGFMIGGTSFDSQKKTFVDINGEPLSSVDICHIPTHYRLTIEGQAITSDNLSVDISNGGTATFDPETRTLTLWNVNSTGIKQSNHNFLTCTDGKPLTIVFSGTNTISNDYMSLSGDVTLVGEDENATLIFDRNGVWPYYRTCSAIELKYYNDNTLKIRDLNVEIKNYDCGILGYTAVSNAVWLDNATLDIDVLEDAARNINTMRLSGCAVITPRRCYSESAMTFVDENGDPAGKISIAPAETTGISLNYGDGKYFDLYTVNAADYLGDGSVCYDAETRTLSLNNADLSGADLELRGIENLKVIITGDNTINNLSVSGCPGIVISGKGNLTIDTQNEALAWYPPTYFDDMLTIEGINLVVRSQYGGICGSQKLEEAALTVRNATVCVMCQGEALYGISNLTLDGCEILEPQNARFDSQWRGVVVDGALATTFLRIGSSLATGISNTTVTAEGDAYDLLGRRVSDSYRGISIRNGKKVVK